MRWHLRPKAANFRADKYRRLGILASCPISWAFWYRSVAKCRGARKGAGQISQLRYAVSAVLYAAQGRTLALLLPQRRQNLPNRANVISRVRGAGKRA